MTRLETLTVAGALVLAGCDDPKSSRGPSNDRLPAEDFVYDTTVLITSPANGRAVPSPLTLTIETGDAIEELEIFANDAPVASTVVASSGSTEVIVALPEGRYTLDARGFDADGIMASAHAISVRILSSQTEPEPWVLVTSPRDNATVANPVAFTIESADSVDRVEIFADDWSIGTIEPGEVLRYDFAGTGFPRAIDAVGFDDEGEVARDELTITVTDASAPGESDVNDIILSHLSAYPTDGSYAYWWPDDSLGWYGNPHDIYYLGRLFAAGDPQNRSYCVGITLEVFMRTFETLDEAYGLGGELNGISFLELDEFRKDWFVRDLYGTGIVEAMENYGIGDRVTDWDNVRPGDIIQFWRHSGSGHNAIFIGWERDGSGEVTGFTYWSTQNATDGIGYNDEFFGTSGSRVDPNFFFVGRVAPPEDWRPWY